MSWANWEKAIRETCSLAIKRGFAPHRDLSLKIGEPMTALRLEEVEKAVGPLPDDYRAVLRAARSVTFSYACSATLEKNVEIHCLGPIEAMWDEGYLEWCGHVASQFGYFEPGHEGQWITPFLHLEDDDFIAFRMDHSAAHGEVFFAAHDDHESKLRIATSFTEFMNRWAALHFPDLESLLRNFWDKERGELVTEGALVDEWGAWLGAG